MQVVFYNVPDSRIKNFEKMTFAEAVQISQEVERTCRDEKINFASEFQVIGEDNRVYYKGLFNFGSYDYPNIYHQIKDMVNRIKVDKKNQDDKLYLLEQLEKLTPDEEKKAEMVDKTLINLDKSRISKFNSWQRKLVYTVGGLSIFGLLTLTSLYFVQQDSYERALESGRNQLKESEKLSQTYETALLENKEEMVVYLEKLDKLSEKQQRILLNNYFSENAFEKAVQVLDGDYVYTETMILTSDLPQEKKVETITAFNEVYPTNEARYDLAYYSKNYELMLNIPTINMTIERSGMKTYALIKLGKIDEAKAELNNNSSEELDKKIIEFEVLTAEIKTLEDRHNLLVKEKKADESKEVQTQIKAKKEELKAL